MGTPVQEKSHGRKPEAMQTLPMRTNGSSFSLTAAPDPALAMADGESPATGTSLALVRPGEQPSLLASHPVLPLDPSGKRGNLMSSSPSKGTHVLPNHLTDRPPWLLPHQRAGARGH